MNRILKYLATLIFAAVLAACGGGGGGGSSGGGGGGGSGAPLTITTASLPGGTVGVAYSATLQATGGSPPYTWSVSQGSLPSWATLNASTGAITGTPNAPSNTTLTFRVTDSNNVTTQTNSLNLVILVPPLSITTTSLPNATVGTAYSATLQASGGAPPYTWSIASGALPAWASLNTNTGAITGMPNASGTTSFTVQVTDSAMVSLTQNLSITANTASGNLGLLSGQYAFVVSGYDSALAGSITVDGKGNITGGTEDIAAPATTLSGSDLNITSGTYTVGSDNRGTLSYTDSNGNKFTFAFALGDITGGVAAQGQVIEFDSNPLEMSGQLALQSAEAFSTSALTGPYVISMPGWDASSGAPQVVVGSFTAGTGALTNGLADVNDGGNVQTALTFTGSLGSISTDGRASLTLNVGGGPKAMTLYVVSAGEWFVVSGTSSAESFIVGGEVMQQSGGPFNASSLSGNTVIKNVSADGLPAPFGMLGLVTWSGTGTASGSVDFDDNGTVSSQSVTGSYSVTNPANGRITFTPSGAQTQAGYMVAPNEAVLVDIAANTISGSFTVEPQSAGPFSNSSLDGSFYLGTVPLMSPGAPAQNGGPTPALNITSGVMTFNGSGAVSATLDVNSSGVPSSGLTGSDTYAVAASGRVTTGSGDLIGYLVGPGKLYWLNVAQGQPDTPNPTIFILQSALPPPLQITTTSLPSGTVGTAYSATLQASGGTPPYTWSISQGSLPAWATLNPANGAITGTPNAGGTTNFTVKVADSENPVASVTANMSLTVGAAPIEDVAVDVNNVDLYKLNSSDGTVVWGPVNLPNCGGIAVDPADYSVYVGSTINCGGSSAGIYKFDSTGTQVWEDTGYAACGTGGAYYIGNGGIAVDQNSADPGIVLAMSGDYGNLGKINLAGTATLWCDGTNDIGRPSILGSTGQIYDVTDAGPTYSYNTIYSATATGSLTSATACEGYTDSNPADGTLYLGGGMTTNGCGLKLYQMSTSTLGSINWSLDLSTDVSSFDALALQPWSGGYIYAASASSSKIVVINPAIQSVVTTFSTVVAPNFIAVDPNGGNIYIASSTGDYVYAYNPSGVLIWTSPKLVGTITSLAVARDVVGNP